MKNNFIKSTIILIIGGFLSKILGMFIKIVLTRTITLDGIGIYSMILPTFNLFITLCSLGLPVAISKLISEKRSVSNKEIVLAPVPFILLFNLILIIILFFISPLLSKYLLKNEITYYPLISIGITLPFICISSIIKGYFYGIEKMMPTIFSNIIEQLMRLFLTMTIIKRLMKYSLTYAITGVVLINVLSEGISILVLLLFLPKGKIINKNFSYNKELIKDIFNISIPTTGSRLIGSIAYFLEPIILNYALTKIGYSNTFITREYGIINGYVYPLLLLPSFFTMAISNALLPVISNSYSHKDYSYTKYKIKQAIFLSLLIGIPATLLFMTIPNVFLNLIYNTNEGLVYIKIIAPIFLIYYIQGPLTACMQAMGLSKIAMLGTLMGTIIRCISLFILSFLHIGLWGLIISSILNILFITIHHYYYVYKVLKQ